MSLSCQCLALSRFSFSDLGSWECWTSSLTPKVFLCPASTGAAVPLTVPEYDTHTLSHPQPEDASGGSSPSGTSKSDANRASSGGGGGGLMEEMNKLLAKR